MGQLAKQTKPYNYGEKEKWYPKLYQHDSWPMAAVRSVGDTHLFHKIKQILQLKFTKILTNITK